MGRWETTGEEWMGAPAAARYMGISLRTLYTILDTGDLPSYKLGRVIRMKTVDVDAYLERCCVQPGSLGHLYPPGEDGDPPRRARPGGQFSAGTTSEVGGASGDFQNRPEPPAGRRRRLLSSAIGHSYPRGTPQP